MGARARASGRRARGKERSMESGIIANVDRLKESREEEILYLTYVTSDRGVSCLRPRPERRGRARALPLSPRGGRPPLFARAVALRRPPRPSRASSFALTVRPARHCP